MKKEVKTKSTVEKPDEKRSHTWGTWTPTRQRTETLTCACGNKYIKTRRNQKTCIWCLFNKESGANKPTKVSRR